MFSSTFNPSLTNLTERNPFAPKGDDGSQMPSSNSSTNTSMQPEFAKLRREKAAIQRENDNLRRENDNLRSANGIANIEAKIEAQYKAKLDEARKALQRDRLAEKTARDALVNRDRMAEKIARDALAAMRTSTTEEIEQLKNINDKLHQKLKYASDEVHQKIEQLTNANDEHHRKIKQLTNANDKLHQKIEQLTYANDELHKEFEQRVQVETEDANLTITKQQQQLDCAIGELGQTKGQLEDTLYELDEARREVDEARMVTEQTLTYSRKLEANLECQEGASEHLRATISALEAGIEETSEALCELRQQYLEREEKELFQKDLDHLLEEFEASNGQALLVRDKRIEVLEERLLQKPLQQELVEAEKSEKVKPSTGQALLAKDERIAALKEKLQQQELGEIEKRKELVLFFERLMAEVEASKHALLVRDERIAALEETLLKKPLQHELVEVEKREEVGLFQECPNLLREVVEASTAQALLIADEKIAVPEEKLLQKTLEQELVEVEKSEMERLLLEDFDQLLVEAQASTGQALLVREESIAVLEEKLPQKNLEQEFDEGMNFDGADGASDVDPLFMSPVCDIISITPRPVAVAASRFKRPVHMILTALMLVFMWKYWVAGRKLRAWELANGTGFWEGQGGVGWEASSSVGLHDRSFFCG